MLRIHFCKQSDGLVILRCMRADGSSTWQRQARYGTHFVLHDLTHYAIESTLSYREGFFGLIAAGWEIADTTGKGTRGSIPPEATEVETIVGLFDSERMSGTWWALDEINRFSPKALNEGEITRIRSLRDGLFHDWSELAIGASLEVEFL